MPFTVSSNEGHVEPGTYPGLLQAVTIKNIVGFSGIAEDVREWQFQVSVNGDLKPLSAISSMNMGPQSKSYKWLTALLRRPLLAGEQLDDPIGANALLVVGDNKKGYSTILDVLPAPQTPQQSTLPDGSSVPR